jgi:hypothetical protein
MASLAYLSASARSPASRASIADSQGEAERGSGEPRFRETLLEAGHLAARLDDAERMARAAVTNSLGWFALPGSSRSRGC